MELQRKSASGLMVSLCYLGEVSTPGCTRKMTMFETVGVGTDWIEIKRQKDEAVAQAEYRKAIATAEAMIQEGLALEIVARCTGLSLEEVYELQLQPH